MKNSHLPETEVANLSFKLPGVKASALADWIKPKKIFGSYEPTRRSVGEAANVELPLELGLDKTTLGQLERLVISECKGDPDKVAMNLTIVRAIRSYIEQNDIETEYLEELPLTLYPGQRYSYWLPLIVREKGQAKIIFCDFRRSNGLSKTGLHFCFSAMHERFRVLNPDYASVLFEVWQFANNELRTVRVVAESLPPIGIARLMADTAETYQILNAVRAGILRPKTGTYGPLFE